VHPEAMTPQARALLPSLAPILARHRFVLAGGTSLALHLGHRLSVDLDFFLDGDVSPDLLIGELRGVQLSPEVLQLARGVSLSMIGGSRVSFF